MNAQLQTRTAPLPRASVAVVAPEKSLRRQIARALYAGSVDLQIVQRAAHTQRTDRGVVPRLVVVDAHGLPFSEVRATVTFARRVGAHVVALCGGADRQTLLQLVETLMVENVVALHLPSRALYPIVDEHELRVTTQKLLREDVFGIDKYVGGWGSEIRTFRVRSTSDRQEALTEFEGFLTDIDCVPRLVPDLVAAADDACFFAAASSGPAQVQTLSFGCDGTRLLFSVSQPSATASWETVRSQLCQVLTGARRASVHAASGGMATSLKRTHQLVANLKPGGPLELVTGWYLRAASTAEFRETARSFNLFRGR